MKRGTIFAGLVGFTTGYILGKDAAKKEGQPPAEKDKSLADEIVDEVERDREQWERQDKPILYKKNKKTLKLLEKRKQ